MSPPVDKRPAGGGGWAIAGIVVAVLGVLCCVGVVPLMLLGGLMLPAVGAARGAARRAQCTNNLKQLGLGFHNHHDVYSRLPTTTADKDGTPLVSWRLPLMPFVEQQAIYEAYDKKEKYDSAANQAIANTSLDMLVCPSDTMASPSSSSYHAVFSNSKAPQHTMFVLDEPARFADVVDGLSNTIMSVEATGINSSWAAPQDLQMEGLPMTINGGVAGASISSMHPGGVNVLLGDGAVRFVSDQIDPATLKNLLLRDDGNMIMAP